MKLLNHTSRYFAGLLLALISIWAVIFYYGMLDEIYDSIDDGLDNQKQLLIQRVSKDPTVLQKTDFAEGNYMIAEIPQPRAMLRKDMYSDTMMYMQNEASFEPVRLLKTVFLFNNRYYALNVATSMVEEDDLVAELLYTLIFLYAGLVISILLLNNFLLKKLWRPFYLLLDRLKNFSLNDPKPMPDLETNIEEFRILNKTAQRMIEHNIAIFTAQKHFIENASHELQTPLAISLNKLETLAENNHSLSANDEQLLASAIDNLERMARLNRSLLLLSKINNRQFSDVTAININALVKKAMDDFEDQLRFSNTRLEFREAGVVNVRMNAGLASVLINNLIKNAIVHNIAGGTIAILMEKNTLHIQNTGAGEALDAQKIFTRFFSQSRSPGSSGLGLAIVKAITDLYGFRAVYSHNGQHHISIHFTPQENAQ